MMYKVVVMSETRYLSISEAAKYLGVSAQTLRRWEATGKIKSVRHPLSGYRFYQLADLAPFRLEFQSGESRTPAIGAVFSMRSSILGNESLREPQRDAYRAALEHFEKSSEHAIIQLPVGCGKTGVIATIPFGLSKGRVLVIAPNLTIRNNIAESLNIASPKCFWRKAKVLDDLSAGPFVAVLDGDDANLHDCNESHFVVTNIQQLASSADKWLPQFPDNYFDMVLVDEGHHNVAASWMRVFQRFPSAKVVSLTATPFRSDQRELQGNVIYKYPFAQAMMKGFIKEIHAANVAPAEVYFTYRGDLRRHTLEEVLDLREEQWFRRGVALSPECNEHIADLSIQKLRLLRTQTGTFHQLIAAACSVEHAKQVRAIFEAKGLKAREIHSDMNAEEQEDVLYSLKQGRLDSIIQVQMLGEGFDHPPLSVAAIFRPFRSLSPYIQFVGRVMRVLRESAPGHVDNHAFVVSHIGLQNDSNWKDFREFDLADQLLFKEWIAARPELHVETEESAGTARRFDRGALIESEILADFLQNSFLDPDDDRVLEKLLAEPLGATGLRVGDLLSKEQLHTKLTEKNAELRGSGEPIPVNPQGRRKMARMRVNDRTSSVANRVLNDLRLSVMGREIGRTFSRVRGKANLPAVIQLLNVRINESLGVESGRRGDLSRHELEAVFRKLDEMADQIVDEYKLKEQQDAEN